MLFAIPFPGTQAQRHNIIGHIIDQEASTQISLLFSNDRLHLSVIFLRLHPVQENTQKSLFFSATIKGMGITCQLRRENSHIAFRLRRQAIDNGVEFIACQMSMEVMGVQREELLDNVTVGGVATYMERAGKANVNLFI